MFLCDIQCKLRTFSILTFENESHFKNEYRFLAESTKIENATFPYKTAMSEASVKANSVEIFGQKGVLRSFTKFTGKHLHQCSVSFLIKLLAHACDFIKKRDSGAGFML